jgi:hypothetical protein
MPDSNNFGFPIQELNKPERHTDEDLPVAPDMNDANNKIDEIIRYMRSVFGGNQPPTVALQLSTRIIEVGKAVTGTAVATDSDGSVVRCELYNGTQLLLSSVTAPFVFTFTPTVAGDYSLYAQAYDNKGAFSKSSLAPLTVTEATSTVQGEKPTIKFSDSENWLDFESIYGDSAILVSTNNGPYVAYSSVPGYNATTKRIDTGDVDRIDGYWKAKAKADTNRTESVITASPAFTKTVVSTTPKATLTFGSLTAKQVGDSPFNLTASSTNTVTPITYTSSDPTIATVSGNTVTLVKAGSVVITANQSAGNGYLAADAVAQTLTVNAVVVTQPTVYDVNLVDGQTDAVTLTRLTTDGTPNATLRYMRPAAGDTSPLDMSIFIGTENVALVNSVSYLGSSNTAYLLDYAGHTYSGTFVNGNSTATFVK